MEPEEAGARAGAAESIAAGACGTRANRTEEAEASAVEEQAVVLAVRVVAGADLEKLRGQGQVVLGVESEAETLADWVEAAEPVQEAADLAALAAQAGLERAAVQAVEGGPDLLEAEQA